MNPTTPTKPLLALARKVAKELFTTGDGKRAVRLQLKLKANYQGGPEQDGGGWCEQAVINIIASELKTALKRKGRK
jgi:hypothetical protein